MNPKQHSDYTWPSAQKTVLESHGADDVAVMAQGPFAHLFSGVYEQVHGKYQRFIQVQAKTVSPTYQWARINYNTIQIVLYNTGSFRTAKLYSHIFLLTLENIPLVAHVAEYALCVGDYTTAPHCPYKL